MQPKLQKNHAKFIPYKPQARTVQATTQPERKILQSHNQGGVFWKVEHAKSLSPNDFSPHSATSTNQQSKEKDKNFIFHAEKYDKWERTKLLPYASMLSEFKLDASSKGDLQKQTSVSSEDSNESLYEQMYVMLTDGKYHTNTSTLGKKKSEKKQMRISIPIRDLLN